MKIYILFVFFILFISYLYLNLGNFLNITKNPSKTQLLVCLGGGVHKKRLNKTIELLQNGFLEGENIIFTGVKKLPKGSDKFFNENVNIIINSKTKNTMEEILYIKDFIKKNYISSVTFITSPPHSRRVKIFWNNFGEDLRNVKFQVVGSELNFWNDKYFYKNQVAKKYAHREIIKLVYNFFIYGILEKLGFKEKFEIYFEKELKENKKDFQKILIHSK